jgi:hypothetical protein
MAGTQHSHISMTVVYHISRRAKVKEPEAYIKPWSQRRPPLPICPDPVDMAPSWPATVPHLPCCPAKDGQMPNTKSESLAYAHLVEHIPKNLVFLDHIIILLGIEIDLQYPAKWNESTTLKD